MNATIRLAVVLFVVCSLAAGSLALVNEVTREPILAQARRETDEALRTVSPNATSFTETGVKSWDAKRGDERIGRVVAVTAKGYSGPIAIVVGVDTEDVLTGVRVTSQTETPGLGNKVATASFLAQFVEKTRAQVRLKKDDPTGTIDAVSAATISSRAVTGAIREATGGQ